MKKAILSILISCATGAIFAQSDKDAPFMTKPLTQSVKDVEVETSGGNVSLQSVAAGQEKVEVYIWASNRGHNNLSKEEIQQRLDQYYTLTIETNGDKLTAIARRKDRKWDSKTALSISFSIYTSRDVSSHLTTSGGNISLQSVTGKQRIVTSGGNLSIGDVKGKLDGTTSGGNITVKGASDDVELTTSGGNIKADDCNGKVKLTTSGGSIALNNLNGDIDATTSGGHIVADEIKGGLEANTSGGNIDLKGLSCDLVTATSGGNIRVAFVSPGKFIKIKNSGGRIDLQLPAGKGYDLALSGNKVKADNLGNFNGKVTDDNIDGKSNGGGTEVRADASSGNVVLTFK